MDEKPWYLSKTIWGAMIMLVSTVLKGAGIIELSAEDQDSLVNMIYNVAYSSTELIGFVIVLWGRITAHSKLKVIK